MTSKTHIAAGTLAALILLNYTKADVIYLFAGATLGSVLPDLDTEQSWIAQTMPYIDDFLRWVSKKANKNKKKGFNKQVHNMLKHRGLLTHSMCTLAIILYIYFFSFTNDFVLGVLVGVISHICMDGLSKFYFSTGTKKEEFVYHAVWVVNFVLIWKLVI